MLPLIEGQKRLFYCPIHLRRIWGHGIKKVHRQLRQEIRVHFEMVEPDLKMNLGAAMAAYRKELAVIRSLMQPISLLPQLRFQFETEGQRSLSFWRGPKL